jgi:hypothetical protein
MNKSEITDAIIGTLHESAKFAKGMIVSFAIDSTLIHALPSFSRYSDRFTDIWDKYDGAEKKGRIIGSYAGMVMGLASGAAYLAHAKDHPEYLLIPATTNLCSFVFERYQDYKKLQKTHLKTNS